MVSVEEYIEAIKNAYEKYGAKLEVLDSSNYTPISREMLELIVKDIEEAGKARLEANLEAERNYRNFLIDSDSLNDISGSENIPFSTMEIDLYHEGKFRVDTNFPGSWTPMGYALIVYSASAKYDANRGIYMSYKPNKIYVESSINYLDHDLTNEWKTANGGRFLTVKIEGTVSFAYQDPITNVKYQTTEPVYVFNTFNGPN